jgi:YaiO family outer membrane protein
MKQFIVLAGILLSGFMASVVAQDAPGGDVVSRARALAIQGQHAAALELLSQRLADNPEDSDARVLRGTVLSWDKNYDDARIELERVLAQHPGHADALEALINVELWSDDYDRVETLSDEALKKNPNNTTLLLSRAQALKGLHKDHEAALVLDHLLAVDPSDAHAAHLLEGLHDGRRLWEAAIDHSSEWYSDGRSTWEEMQVSLTRHTSMGPVIGRYYHADWFSSGSNQWEVEAYPRIRPGTYGYVEAGLSPDATFYPHYRAGGEIYQNLTHGFEGSAGYRWLDFSTAVNIFTGSITKYQGNWMFTGRIYSTPDSAGTSNALQFLTRRYFGDGGNYLGVRYGWGSSVVETPSLLATQVLSSSNYYGEANWAIKRRWTMNIKGGAFFEDQVHRGNLRHYLCDTSLFFRF